MLLPSTRSDGAAPPLHLSAVGRRVEGPLRHDARTDGCWETTIGPLIQRKGQHLMGQSMEHLLGMIADIASSVWQFALNLPGALQIVFTLVALIVAGVCRMVAMRLSHPAFTETDGSAVDKKNHPGHRLHPHGRVSVCLSARTGSRVRATHRPCLISQSTTRGRNHMTCRMIPALASFYQTRSFDKGPIGHDPTHHRGKAFRRSSHRPGTRHVCHQEGRVSAMRGHARHLGARPPRQPRYPGPVPGPRLGALADGYAAP